MARKSEGPLGQFPCQAAQKPQPPAPGIGAELSDIHEAKVMALGIGQEFVQGVADVPENGRKPDEHGNFNTCASGKC